MKIEIDTTNDITYIRLTKEKVVKTAEQDGYIIDLDKNGNIVGIEYLNLPEIERR